MKAKDKLAHYARTFALLMKHAGTNPNPETIANDIAALRRAACILDRANERECSKEMSEKALAALDKRTANAMKRATAIGAKYGALAHTQSDPRGPSIRLYWLADIPAGQDAAGCTSQMHAVKLD